MIAAIIGFWVALACTSSLRLPAGTLCGRATSFARTFDVALASSQANVPHSFSDRDLRHSWPMSINYIVEADLARSHGILLDEIGTKKGGVQETSTHSNLVVGFVCMSFVVHNYTRDSTNT